MSYLAHISDAANLHAVLSLRQILLQTFCAFARATQICFSKPSINVKIYAFSVFCWTIILLLISSFSKFVVSAKTLELSSLGILETYLISFSLRTRRCVNLEVLQHGLLTLIDVSSYDGFAIKYASQISLVLVNAQKVCKKFGQR